MSRNSGSPSEPGSFVRSSTAMRRTRGGQRVEQRLRRKRPVQPHLDHADPLAPGVERSDGLPHGLAAGAHTTSTRSASGSPVYSTMR